MSSTLGEMKRHCSAGSFAGSKHHSPPSSTPAQVLPLASTTTPVIRCPCFAGSQFSAIGTIAPGNGRIPARITGRVVALEEANDLDSRDRKTIQPTSERISSKTRMIRTVLFRFELLILIRRNRTPSYRVTWRSSLSTPLDVRRFILPDNFPGATPDAWRAIGCTERSPRSRSRSAGAPRAMRAKVPFRNRGRLRSAA